MSVAATLGGASEGFDTARACQLLWRAYAGCGLAQRMLAAARPLIGRFDRVLPCIPTGARVFDIGCGNGLLLALAGENAALRAGVGVDVNAAALGAARRMAAARSLPLRFEQAGTAEAWPAGQYDVVLMVDVLHHVPAAARRGLVAAALARVRPGGLLVYKDMCARPAFRRLWNLAHDAVLARQVVVVEPIEHVIDWATAVGFARVASERYVGAWLYGHELEVFRRPAAEKIQK